FGPRPVPVSGFYVAVVFEGDIVLLVGDLEKLHSLVLQREHVFENRFYTIRTDFGGKSRGSERFEVDGYPIQLYGVFITGYMTKIVRPMMIMGNESIQLQECFDDDNNGGNNTPKKGEKMKKKLLVKTRSSSSSSISSASSGSSTVLEWESV
ncbi:30S ribosomal protein S9, partial [Bienertia sinuspersici]